MIYHFRAPITWSILHIPLNSTVSQIVPLMSMKRDCLSASDILSIRKVMEHVYQRLLKLTESFSMNNVPATTPPTPHSMNTLGTRVTSPYANMDRFGQGKINLLLERFWFVPLFAFGVSFPSSNKYIWSKHQYSLNAFSSPRQERTSFPADS